MDIQMMHMQNNFYREMITKLKAEINEYDKKIMMNERLIGNQLGDMAQEVGIGPTDCTLCMGECSNEQEH